MFSKIVSPVLRLAAFTALVRGIFLWLKDSHNIDVERWVATMIGAAESMAVEAPSWVVWTLAGGAGLLFTTIWEIAKYRGWSPWQREEYKPSPQSNANVIHAQADLVKQNRLQDKQDQVREGLRDGASNRRIRMTVGEDGPYFGTEGSVFDIRRTFNLKLENTDQSKSFSDCSIQIMEVVPPTDDEGPWLLKDGITLAAGAHTFVPLVTYGEAQEPDKYDCGDTFVTMETSTGRPTLDVGPKYAVTLRATAPETAFCELQCNVWVDGDGRLRIANTTTTTTDKPAAIPLDQASLFAYVNGEPRVRTLDRKIAGKLGKEYQDYVGERASLNEILQKFQIQTIRELDDLLEEKSDLILKLCAYAIPEGAIEKGYSLEVLTWVLGAEMGTEHYIQLLASCKYTSTSQGWVEEIVSAYTQLTKHV